MAVGGHFSSGEFVRKSGSVALTPHCIAKFPRIIVIFAFRVPFSFHIFAALSRSPTAFARQVLEHVLRPVPV